MVVCSRPTGGVELTSLRHGSASDSPGVTPLGSHVRWKFALGDFPSARCPLLVKTGLTATDARVRKGQERTTSQAPGSCSLVNLRNEFVGFLRFFKAENLREAASKCVSFRV